MAMSCIEVFWKVLVSLARWRRPRQPVKGEGPVSSTWFVCASCVLWVSGCDARGSLAGRCEGAFMAGNYSGCREWAMKMVEQRDLVPQALMHQAFACHGLGLWEEGLESFVSAMERVGWRTDGNWWQIGSCSKSPDTLNLVYIHLLEQCGKWDEAIRYCEQIGNSDGMLRSMISVGDLEGAGSLLGNLTIVDSDYLEAWRLLVGYDFDESLGAQSTGSATPEGDAVGSALELCLRGQPLPRDGYSGLVDGGFAIAQGLSTLGLLDCAETLWEDVLPRVPPSNPAWRTVALVWSGYVRAAN